MKMIKCDRCGKVDPGGMMVNCEGEKFYTGSLERYQYSDVPEFIPVDLCRACNSELYRLVNEFMETVNNQQPR